MKLAARMDYAVVGGSLGLGVPLLRSMTTDEKRDVDGTPVSFTDFVFRAYMGIFPWGVGSCIPDSDRSVGTSSPIVASAFIVCFFFGENHNQIGVLFLGSQNHKIHKKTKTNN